MPLAAPRLKALAPQLARFAGDPLKYSAARKIVAINGDEFLSDERDGKYPGDNSTAAFKRLYRIDLRGAQEESGITGATSLAGHAVAKTLFLDVVAALHPNGIGSNDIPAKLEGVAFGPDVVVNGVTRHTFFIASENDVIATVKDGNHRAGIDNPNRFFVFAVDIVDVPGFVSQRIKTDDDLLCIDPHGDERGWTEGSRSGDRYRW